MRWILIFLLVLPGMAAGRQTIHKCVVDGQHHYQSQPCDGHSLAQWEVPPELARADPAIERHNQALLEQMRRQWRHPDTASERRSRPATRSTARARAPRQSSSTVSACAKARADRATAYQRLGLKRTFAQSRHWDGVVFDACK